jgi:four helix bundle protein
MKKSYRDLFIWREAVELAVEVCRLTTRAQWAKHASLAGQAQRAGISVASNIAEGSGRLSARDFRKYLGIARGSLRELDTQLEIAARLGLLETADELPRARVARIGAGISRLLDYLDAGS